MTSRAAQSELDVVNYEVEMLAFSAGRIAALPGGDSNERNAFTEVFLLHTCSLWEFLTVPQAKRDNIRASTQKKGPAQIDDIVAADLLSPPADGQWDADDHAAAMPVIRDLKDRIDKELAHPSRGRIGSKTDWEVGVMFEELWGELENFKALQTASARPPVELPPSTFVKSLAGTVTYTNHVAASTFLRTT